MNTIGLLFTLAASLLQLALPRRLAAIPLLAGALFITRDQLIMVGPAHFTVIQILVTVGMIRIVLRGESLTGGLNSVDRVLIIWAVWLIGSSAFHVSTVWLYRAGVLWMSLGSYFLFRVFIRDDEDVKYVFKVLSILLTPVAMLMLLEKFTGKDYIAALGGVTVVPNLREGHFRAQGAFAHPILAGTAGAGCFPMAMYLWRHHRKFSLLGLFGAGGMIFAATSSGPVMMLIFCLFGLALWRIRDYLRMFRWMTLVGVIMLDTVMKAPVYFLMARIDIAGGSTGYYRAQLIRSAIEHLDEWWAIGTDYTRHWMATGVPANTQQADLTNHFISMGVNGGLLLLILFILALSAAFNAVGKVLKKNRRGSHEHRYLGWTLGATLFGYVWVFFSISLFDQSVVFFDLILACIGAVQVSTALEEAGAATQAVVRIRKSRYAEAGANGMEGDGSGRRKIPSLRSAG